MLQLALPAKPPAGHSIFPGISQRQNVHPDVVGILPIIIGDWYQLFTVTVSNSAVSQPVASRATTESVWVPLAAEVVSHWKT